ncbi:LysR family transcriptional regulator [Bordetella genomosp. 9]|uniref:LysR family transcriptional regulator n=1 Tax=Bordetella genomosp. 9 TaxID=1416803 RepID=A0A1W6Z1Y9_9BORD|nr:LysR family transcriptional regulator [Bordetella genomosp. 9]ARP87402.1 LysR family transcriptional regulator [Bordetella genomosp. 9]ARP91382.1 LysR family transcriptional regulator [Bordetella genomosp. 9]
MNFSLRQLQAFIAVARHASFTKAAEQFHITQAGLSAMVRDLETQLNCQLFERTTRVVRLTPAGAQLLPVVMRTVGELGVAVADAASLERPRRNRARIGVTPLIACSVIPEVLRRFGQIAPQADIEVADLDRRLIQQQVERGELDAGFGAFFHRVSGMRRRALFQWHLVLAMAPGARRAPQAVGWRDIATDGLISLPRDNPIQQLVDRRLRIAPGDGLASSGRTVTHLETALALVEAGLGQAVVPSFAAIARSRWRVRFARVEPMTALDYYCITRAGSAASPLVDQFAATFAAVAARHMSA